VSKSGQKYPETNFCGCEVHISFLPKKGIQLALQHNFKCIVLEVPRTMYSAFKKEMVYGIHKKGANWILKMSEMDSSPSAEVSLARSDLELASCWRRRALEPDACSTFLL
jgi:hypothetical protein